MDVAEGNISTVSKQQLNGTSSNGFSMHDMELKSRNGNQDWPPFPSSKAANGTTLVGVGMQSQTDRVKGASNGKPFSLKAPSSPASPAARPALSSASPFKLRPSRLSPQSKAQGLNLSVSSRPPTPGQQVSDGMAPSPSLSFTGVNGEASRSKPQVLNLSASSRAQTPSPPASEVTQILGSSFTGIIGEAKCPGCGTHFEVSLESERPSSPLLDPNCPDLALQRPSDTPILDPKIRFDASWNSSQRGSPRTPLQNGMPLAFSTPSPREVGGSQPMGEKWSSTSMLESFKQLVSPLKVILKSSSAPYGQRKEFKAPPERQEELACPLENSGEDQRPSVNSGQSFGDQVVSAQLQTGMELACSLEPKHQKQEQQQVSFEQPGEDSFPSGHGPQTAWAEMERPGEGKMVTEARTQQGPQTAWAEMERPGEGKMVTEARTQQGVEEQLKTNFKAHSGMGPLHQFLEQTEALSAPLTETSSTIEPTVGIPQKIPDLPSEDGQNGIGGKLTDVESGEEIHEKFDAGEMQELDDGAGPDHFGKTDINGDPSPTWRDPEDDPRKQGLEPVMGSNGLSQDERDEGETYPCPAVVRFLVDGNLADDLEPTQPSPRKKQGDVPQWEEEGPSHPERGKEGSSPGEEGWKTPPLSGASKRVKPVGVASEGGWEEGGNSQPEELENSLADDAATSAAGEEGSFVEDPIQEDKTAPGGEACPDEPSGIALRMWLEADLPISEEIYSNQNTLPREEQYVASVDEKTGSEKTVEGKDVQEECGDPVVNGYMSSVREEWTGPAELENPTIAEEGKRELPVEQGDLKWGECWEENTQECLEEPEQLGEQEDESDEAENKCPGEDWEASDERLDQDLGGGTEEIWDGAGSECPEKLEEQEDEIDKAENKRPGEDWEASEERLDQDLRRDTEEIWEGAGSECPEKLEEQEDEIDKAENKRVGEDWEASDDRLDQDLGGGTEETWDGAGTECPERARRGQKASGVPAQRNATKLLTCRDILLSIATRGRPKDPWPCLLCDVKCASTLKWQEHIRSCHAVDEETAQKDFKWQPVYEALKEVHAVRLGIKRCYLCNTFWEWRGSAVLCHILLSHLAPLSPHLCDQVRAMFKEGSGVDVPLDPGMEQGCRYCRFVSPSVFNAAEHFKRSHFVHCFERICLEKQ